MLRYVLYRVMYLNNFVYLEEYIVFALVSLISAVIGLNIYIITITLLALLLIFSPRSPLVQWMDSGWETQREPQNVTRPRIGDFYRTKEGLFDSSRRRLYLRGVNIGGKLPLGHTTWSQPPQKGDFIGSLFDKASTETHLERLASCGFTLLRLNVTWEAIEPNAEGVYNTDYIAYLVYIIRECQRHNMWVIIDSHQDVWSRWTGGDGAPKWTMERLGMNPDVFSHTRSAMLHCEDTGHMSWFTNHTLYGAGTMFTLFFGGHRFAPKTTVNGKNVQEWLQSAYIRAWCKVAEALAGEKNVLGFESMNEPNAGWIGLSDLNQLPLPGFIGWAITPWDSIRLANGESLDVASFRCVNAYSGTKLANPLHHSVWKEGYTDIWKTNGVWGDGLIKSDYFRLNQGETFESNFLTPFNRRFAQEITAHNKNWWIMCDPLPDDISSGVASPHWYDNLTLVLNRYITYMALSSNMSFVYPYYAPWTYKKSLENCISTGPIFLGEVGIPWLGSVRQTSRALEGTLSAVDQCFPSAVTVWNYNPHHTERFGDGWNLEDFSIWDPQASFRMPNAVRPYVMLLAGKPLSVRWEPFGSKKKFTLKFKPDSNSTSSLIFLPQMHYPMGARVWTSDGGVVNHDKVQQSIEYTHTQGKGVKRLIITAL